MAPRPREAPSNGLLASAFSFVTRELESFVTAATGGEVLKDRPEASSSRVTLDGKRREREGGKERKGEKEKERERRVKKRVRKQSEVEADRARARRKLREEVDGERATKIAKKKSGQVVLREREAERERERSSEREADEDDELPIRPLPKSLKKRREAGGKSVQRDDIVDEAPEPPPRTREKRVAKDTGDPSKLMPPPPNPRPPPTPATTRMTPFPTMPGSLFPRSESLIPESIPSSYRRTLPLPQTPSPPHLASVEESVEDAPQEVSESVAADPAESPHRGRSKDRQQEADVQTPRSSSARESPRRSEVSSRSASNPRQSIEEPVEPEIRPRSHKGKERACDTSGEIRVRGMEQELREAREDHARNAYERDDSGRARDKQRIRMLEEEVARLRAELAKTSSASMPPPPPPPPPPLFRPVAVSIPSGEPSTYLASARASLKPTAPPVEAPINSGPRTRKTGQPTLNLSGDKMAAFLREMKTVRLRKVSGGSGSMGPPLFPPSAAGDVAGEPTRSLSGVGMSDARRAATLGDASFDAGVAARMFIGEKRKRDVLDEAMAGPAKRREATFARSNKAGPSSASSSQSDATAPSSSSQSSSSASSSQSSTSTSATSIFDLPPTRTQPSHTRLTAPLRIWPARATETEMTTPSLCSDNENEHSEDKVPDTPSDGGRGNDDNAQSVLPRERQPQAQEEPEIIDVDALETPPRRQDSPSPLERKDAFSRRPPASPMPFRSPSKPLPPARVKTRAVPAQSKLPRRVPIALPPLSLEADGSESDDPLATSLSQSHVRAHSRGRRSGDEWEGEPVAGPSRAFARERNGSVSRRSRSQSRTQLQAEVEAEEAEVDVDERRRSESRLSNHARRRLTLDEELKRAGDSLWRDEEEERERPPSATPEDLDSGQLVAMGTKSSKKGFLARGGGAGAPVFMGEGYVQGAVAEEWLKMRRSRSGSTAGGSRAAGR